MDENAKLILELSRPEDGTDEYEPILNDVNSLLEEGRKRIYTQEGERLVANARRRKKSEE